MVGLGVVDVMKVVVVDLRVLVVVVAAETQLPSILLITGGRGTQRLFEQWGAKGKFIGLSLK